MSAVIMRRMAPIGEMDQGRRMEAIVSEHPGRRVGEQEISPLYRCTGNSKIGATHHTEVIVQIAAILHVVLLGPFFLHIWRERIKSAILSSEVVYRGSSCVSKRPSRFRSIDICCGTSAWQPSEMEEITHSSSKAGCAWISTPPLSSACHRRYLTGGNLEEARTKRLYCIIAPVSKKHKVPGATHLQQYTT